MTTHVLPGHEYLAELLEAVQCCAYFLDGSTKRLTWPLTKEFLVDHRMSIDVFETVAAINERFAKLQDTLGAAMRHAAHDYGTDSSVLAEHFNTLHPLTPFLYETARRFVLYCWDELSVEPKSQDFALEFERVAHALE